MSREHLLLETLKILVDLRKAKTVSVTTFLFSAHVYENATRDLESKRQDGIHKWHVEHLRADRTTYVSSLTCIDSLFPCYGTQAFKKIDRLSKKRMRERKIAHRWVHHRPPSIMHVVMNIEALDKRSYELHSCGPTRHVHIRLAKVKF